MYRKTSTTEWVNRAQAFTLEGIVSSMLVISVALIFSLQVTAITPLSASTSSQHIENQQAEIAQGLLDSTPRGELAQTILYWNNSSQKYHNSDQDGVYRVEPPETKFGNMTQEQLLDKGIGANIEIIYYTNSTTYNQDSYRVFTTGSPSNHANTVTRRVPIYESDVIYNEDGTKSSTKVGNSTFYMNNIDQNSELYNIAVIRITVWRI